MSNRNKYRRYISHTFFDARPNVKILRKQEKEARKKQSEFIFSASFNPSASHLVTFLLFTMIIFAYLPRSSASQQITKRFPISSSTESFQHNNITSEIQFFSSHEMPTKIQESLSHAVIVQNLNEANRWLSERPVFNHIRIPIKNQNLSLLDIALMQKDMSMAKTLLAHGAIINTDNLVYVIGHAINDDDLDFIKQLRGINIDFSDSKLKDIIFPLACVKGRMAIVKYFLEDNVLGEISCKLLSKALLNAQNNHQEKIVDYLLAYQKANTEKIREDLKPTRQF
jgi:hypothetical protein